MADIDSQLNTFSLWLTLIHSYYLQYYHTPLLPGNIYSMLYIYCVADGLLSQCEGA